MEMVGSNSSSYCLKLKTSNTLKLLKFQGLRYKKSLKIKNLEMVGVSCSLAFNGNSELCFKTLSFAKLSSLSSFALEPSKQSSRFVGVRLPYINFVNYIKNWRWWESNPRPLWIKTDIYECSYLLSRTGMESNLT